MLLATLVHLQPALLIKGLNSQSPKVNAFGLMLVLFAQTGGSPSPFAAMLPWVHSTEHGIIFGWTGNPLYLPDGFVACDGNNGTPDLMDRFVVGALSVYSVGEKNGVSVHVHSFDTAAHNHSLQSGDEIHTGTAGDNSFMTSPITGTTDPADHTPLYYALMFLMKV